jgi:hypothetical protein
MPMNSRPAADPELPPRLDAPLSRLDAPLSRRARL